MSAFSSLQRLSLLHGFANKASSESFVPPAICCCCSVSKSGPVLCDSWTAARQESLFSTISHSLLKFMFIESLMLSNHLTLCLSLLLLPSIFPSIGVFSSKSALRIRWPKYWSFSFSNSPSNEYSGLISFRMDWLDFLAVQGTQESSPAPADQCFNTSFPKSKLLLGFLVRTF